VNEETREQEYSKIQRRINILGGVIFVGATAVFILIGTRIFDATWTEWWVGASGLLFGLGIALAFSVLMDYAVGREYELIELSLWEYVLVRFQFLFVLFLLPMGITVVIGAVVNTYFRGSLAWSIVLPRGVAFVVLIVFAGFVLPYLFGKITDAKPVGRDVGSLVDNIAKKIGVTIQGVYKVPLKGLRRANAVHIGFLEGKKVVYLLGSWKKHFTKNELRAVLAHEFAHAKYNHIRKLLIVQLLCRFGLPGLIFLSIDSAIKILQIPKPAPVGIILAFIVPALVLLLGSYLFPSWLSRKYETQADLRAAEICGAGAMISALRTLAELNLIPRKSSHPFSTHPSVDERNKALKESFAT
jgi:Zn-dependent protease with chaperone function